MNDEEGVAVAISPVQMVAILHRKTVSEGETWSNRLWGGLGVVGGVIESFGAGALCIVPEPTMLSKAGCVIVGTHSLDTIKTSLDQVITGRKSQTATAQLTKLAAEQFGADTATAYKVGVTVDLLVPLAFASAAGAVRIASVYSGRIRLVDNESAALGHTIARHIGLSQAQMIARLTAPKAPARASTFLNTRHAELLISEVLSAKRYQIESALKYMQSGSRLRLDHRFYFSTGRYIDKGSTVVKKAYGLRIIIEARKFNNKTYYIVTAYPVP
ncbi:RNase A-like domain-containing protein [Erwinia sp. BNK-24-b]|uniref:RNase A-like domain-containing protein n=1 Tax=unclassified Erwinia TaxID=2622719 RepID=UPI0039BEF7BF